MKRLISIVSLFLLVGSCTCDRHDKEMPSGDLKEEQVTPSTDVDGNPIILMKTSLGDIKLELFKDMAPITVENLLAYSEEGFYEGTIFHRVISDFMIQGGGFEPRMKQKKTRPPIKNEAANGISNRRGTIAMARTGVVDSATSQFFINHKDNMKLDHRDNTAREFGYTVFGKVIEGMDIVDKIAAVKTQTHGHFKDVPVKDVVIKSVTLAK